MRLLSELWLPPVRLHFNYFLELCALIFLVAITIAYLSRKKFPVSIFKLFRVCLFLVVANVSLDILSCVLLDYSDTVPIIFCEIVTDLFYFTQVTMSYLLFAYILNTIGKSIHYAKVYYLTTIPSIIAILIILTNPIHHWIFSLPETISGVNDFIHGPAFIVLYIACGLNIFSTMVYTITFRKKLSNRLLLALFSITAIIVVYNIIQFIHPQYLLTGVAYTLSTMFVIVTVNNPDDMVDRSSKAFNNDALVYYINSQRQERQRRYYIVFDIESLGMFSATFGVVYANDLISSIRRFIERENKKTYIFKTQSSEFVLLLKTKEEQENMLKAIKKRFDEPFYIKDKVLNISISLFYFYNNGVFKNSDSYNEFIDRALSTINFRDTNYVELDETFINRINRDRRIREILEDCLKKKEGLHMVYQPIYDVNKKCFNHFEALIRLDNDELGYVGPAEFIPIAESFGLANEIDYFVLNETCAFLKRNPKIESLEINISCAEFFNNPSERFIKTIKKYHIDPRRICLEITETVAVKYPQKTKEFMDDLGQYGIQFAMDDFGSGYSNIARFITLPFSIAKLDKTLLEDATNIKIFFDSAINLFKNLNIPLVIEGVETEDQLAVAKEKQIDYIQGYYFSTPLKENDLLDFLKNH